MIQIIVWFLLLDFFLRMYFVIWNLIEKSKARKRDKAIQGVRDMALSLAKSPTKIKVN